MRRIDYAEIYDAATFRMLGVVDVFKSIIWHTCYYSTGDFEIYCAETEGNASLLKVGRWVKIPNDKAVAIIERVETSWSAQDGRMLIVTGRMATSILDRRIIYKRPIKSGGEQSNIVYPTIINGNVQQAIVSLLNDCFINPEDTQRKVTALSTEIASSSSAVLTGDDGTAAERQITYKGLLEYVEGLLEEYSLGARVIFKDGKLCYSQYVGEELSMIFSTEFDNLSSSAYTEDESGYKNVALVAGQEEQLDESTKRQTTLIFGSQYSGLDRREAYIDASSLSKTYEDASGNEQTYSDADYQSMMRSYGKNELASMKRIKSLSGAINISTTGLEIGKDFSLGDVVTIQDRKIGVYSQSRILEATEVQDENGYSIDIVYGG